MDVSIVTAFAQLLDSFVISGDSESRLSILQIDWSSKSEKPLAADDYTLRNLNSISSIGKCSHTPVNSVSALNQRILATSGLSASIWDAVEKSRLRHFSTSDALYCAQWITPDLIAVAGNACAVSLYDIRIHNLTPIMSQTVAQDNLYAMCVDQGTVFCGGADGNMYKMDLRNELLEKWELPRKDAILDMKMSGRSGGSSGGRSVVALTESGTIYKIGQTGQNYDFVHETGRRLSNRVKMDVAESRLGTRIACGSECGLAHVLDVDEKGRKREKEVSLGDGMVAAVEWSEFGLLAANKNRVVLIEGLNQI